MGIRVVLLGAKRNVFDKVSFNSSLENTHSSSPCLGLLIRRTASLPGLDVPLFIHVLTQHFNNLGAWLAPFMAVALQRKELS